MIHRHVKYLHGVAKVLLPAVMLMCALAARADDAERLRAKALRFYNNEEWLNAQATYLLVLDQEPGNVDAYAHSIVTDATLADTAGVTDMLQRSAIHNVSTDSVLNAVQRLSMARGESAMYRGILQLTQQQFPWLSRKIERRLLDYYLFRDNGPEIVSYARKLLDGMPDNVEFQMALARGYLLSEEPDKAREIWLQVLDTRPDDVDALLAIGNNLLSSGQREDALPYLQRAYALRPTPYLHKILHP